MSLEFRHSYTKIIDNLSPGETTRINHKDCPAGEDTRARLYITKPATAGGRVLAYCHNCQDGNTWKSLEEFRIPMYDDHDISNIEETLLFTTPEIEKDPRVWPKDMLYYFYSMGLDIDLLERYGIAYYAHSHSIYFPIFEKYMPTKLGQNYNGYQLRRLHKRSGSKYSTHLISDEADMATLLYNCSPESAKRSYIVEDVLSGLKLIQCESAPCEVLVNRGTRINLEAINSMVAGPYFYVWLDNDSDHVAKQAETMARTAKLLHPSSHIKIVKDMQDPKHHSADDIYEVVNDG